MIATIMFICRGDDFRTEFAHLGEVRSLLPPGVCVLALTATATKSLRSAVCRTLGMKNPYHVTVSPDKSNIFFFVSEFDSLEKTFKPLIN